MTGSIGLSRESDRKESEAKKERMTSQNKETKE
jgi:hypothetical protein